MPKKTSKFTLNTEHSIREVKSISPVRPKPSSKTSLKCQVDSVLASLKRLADERVLNDMSERYGVYTARAFGVSMSNIQKVAKPLGKSHELAEALWKTGWYEARMVTSFVDDPKLVTP